MRVFDKDLVAMFGRVWHRIELGTHVLPAQNKKVVGCHDSPRERPRRPCLSVAVMVSGVCMASC